MKIKDFNDMSEILAEEQAAQDEADERVRPWQADLKVGDKFVKYAHGLVIFGEVLDPVEEERKAGADEDEVEYTRELYSEPHMQNYRMCRCFSVTCPNGEMGDVHISTIGAVITNDQFEDARKAGWRT